LDLLGQDQSSAPEWFFTAVPARSWGRYTTTLVPREQYDGLLYFEEVRAPTYTY
jgi:erythromycin esterase